jgi:hypothetical protein
MLAGIILVLVVSLYRLLPVLLGYTDVQPDWLINFSPMTAVILCGAACLPRRWAIALPFAALLGTDMILTAHYGTHALFNVEFIVKTGVLAVIAAFGWQLRSQARAAVLVPTAIGGSLFFYLATNSAAWLTDPGYVKSLGGWVQSLTTGLPQYRPTWTFYQNSFLSDVIFTLLFLACVRRRAAAPAAQRPAVAAQW